MYSSLTFYILKLETVHLLHSAHLTREMKERLEDSDFDTIDNGNKYFKYYDKHNTYFEFISFNKLVKDAKLRNKIFNKKLNLVE